MSLPELETWFQAEFGDGGGGDVGRAAVDFAGWTVPPDVRVAEGRLYWEDGELLPDGRRRWPNPRSRVGEVRPDMLGRFMDTWDDETGDRISDFATTFGVLWLCDRGLPVGHDRPGPYPAGRHDGCLLPGWMNGSPYVELEAWRSWARRALSLVTIAAKLQMSELPDPEHWAAQRVGVPRPHRPGYPPLRWRQWSTEEAIDIERKIAAHLVNEWLALGHVSLSARWEPDAVALATRATGQGLFGALALQLLLTTARSDGLAICSSCGLPYAPTRKPPAGRDHYCQTCGKQAARREASRRWRAKKRAEKGDA